jgi:Prp8 binding protein
MATTDAYSVLPPAKRLRNEEGDAIVQFDESNEVRASSLASPTMHLSGHSGSVYALEYSPDGSTLCSASFDKTCLLWSHADYNNFNVLKGHKNAVLDCHWLDNDTVATVGADQMVMLWDALTGQRLRKWSDGHTAIVNACAKVSEQTLISASDDGSCCLWDRRQKPVVCRLPSDLPVLAVTGTGTTIWAAGIDPKITAWDLKMEKRSYAMTGHTDTVTSLALHPEETHVLSNSVDGFLKEWDIRPFLGIGNSKRHVKDFAGHKHNAERGLLKCAWSGDAKLVTCGSGDKLVHIWDEFTTQELYMLPGHKGCVNSVVFHPTENVVASGSSDKQIYVGELS